MFTKQNNRGAVLLMAASLLLPLASCTDTATGEPDTDARAISFTPAAETRAAVDGGSLPDDFLVWGGYNPEFPLFEGETVHPNGTYDNGLRYWVPGTYNFYAVYPATIKDKTTFSNGTLTVKNFDCSKTGEDAVDLMTAISPSIPYEAGNDPQPVAMKFQHELARVKFTVKSENTVATVSTFKVYGVNYQGTLTKGQTATWDPVTPCTEANTPYKLEKFTFNTTNGFEKDMLGDVLLIPDTDLTDAKLYIAYRYQGDTVDRTSTIDLQTTAITQWDAGKSYHYTLTIKGGTLTITVKVADWKEEDTSVSWG